jgi:hypothetical protein
VSSPTIPVSDLSGDRVELPSGGWVQLRHLDDLRSHHREAVLDAFPDDDRLTPKAVLVMQRTMAAVMVVAWSLPYLPDAPLPGDDPTVMRDIRVRDEKRLMKALKPVMDMLDPDAPDPADHENPDSPTEPSGDSAPA